MIVQFSCRGERPFARKRSWLESLPFTRKMGQEENCQSLFSLSSSRERSERLQCALSRFLQPSALYIVIPNLFRDLCFDPFGGRWTFDGQRSFQQPSAFFPPKRRAFHKEPVSSPFAKPTMIYQGSN